MSPYNGGTETNWLTIDPTSLGYVDASAIESTGGATTVSPKQVVSKLPTVAPAAHCTLWNNAGVVTSTTCP